MGIFVNDVSDSEKYKLWIPKIEKYQQQLKADTIAEYLLPQSELPELDELFDATEVPYKVLSSREIEITDSSASELVRKIVEGHLTAVETLNAFLKRATIASQLTNCVTQFIATEGQKRAEELDKYYADTGKTVGPLHGLPVSVKEHYKMKGKVTHAGYVSLIESVSDEDALAVEVLGDAGAVFYVRTTQPQTLMHLDSDNSITGKTKNPRNLSLSPGGSSSGEGALVAMGGSPVGVGSDIGGSIRAPAAFCGCWGFKPTSKRLSVLGMVPTTPLQDIVPCTSGPLTRNCEDIELFMRAYLLMEPWKKDSGAIRLPWREVSFRKPSDLKIAIMYDDGMVLPLPPIFRGLEYAKEKLEKNGAHIKTWEPYSSSEIYSLCGKAYNIDGNKSQRMSLISSGEPLKPLSVHALQVECGDNGLETFEYIKLANYRDKMRDRYLHLMNDKDIDFILCPTYVGVAGKPETPTHWLYTNLWNFLDMPGVSFPTGLAVDPVLDTKNKSFQYRTKKEESEHESYDPNDFKNAPINLQLVTRRYDDEEVLAAAKLISEILSS